MISQGTFIPKNKDITKKRGKISLKINGVKLEDNDTDRKKYN
jgi:hypothetical protein